MKTTVEITDALLERAKKLAKRDGVSLRTLLEEGLHQSLAARSAKTSRRIRITPVGEGGLTKEFADASWAQMRDAIYNRPSIEWEDGSHP